MAIKEQQNDFLFATPDQNGKAPKSRLQNASDAYFMANQLRADDLQRDLRRSTTYRCFRGFAPTDYSNVVAKQMQTTSNVNWLSMSHRINARKSGYIDMVTDRQTAADIRTKIGTPKERIEYGNKIAQAYNMALWDWPGYFTNTEITVEEMLLNGKGMEIRDQKAMWHTRSYHNSQVLIPDGTRTDLTNLEEWCIKDSYKPVEFWNKFKNSKDNKDSGWNFWACLDALRTCTGQIDWRNISNEEYLRRIAAGDINLNRYYFKTVDVYTVFIKEYDNTITKMVVLRSYGAILTGRKMESEDEYLNKAGFLYCQQGYEKDGWSNILYPFYGACGSGIWHDNPGYGQQIYPQCREYDILTNYEVDQMRYQSLIALKGNNAQQTMLLKQMEVGNGMFVLPDGVDLVQRGVQVDIRQLEMAKQSIMGDMDRGTANYGMVEGRSQQTARESELNYAQQNKLDGTELRRFNIGQTRWQWGLYKNLTQCKAGWIGYEQFKKFKERLKDQKVPEEAWQPENIEYFDSNFLSVTGANKIIALQKVVGLAAGQNTTEGEKTAKQMLISALIGRQNVDAVLPDSEIDIPDEQKVISFENAGLLDPNANPENFQALPTENQLEHIRGHFSDAMYTADQCLQFIQSGQADAKYVANMGKALLNKGGHLTAHINILSTDPAKKNEVKAIMQNMEVLKGKTDEILNIGAEMGQKQEPKAASAEELELQYEAAKASLKLDYQEKSQQIKLATKAESHAQKQEQSKDKASTDIAIKRAKAESEHAAEQRKPKPRAGKTTPAVASPEQGA